MPALDVRNAAGESVGSVTLDERLFDVEANTALLHQVVVAQLAAARAGTQSTKTRAEVAGGGRKPWRQKGTGRARHGSIRSPQWIGGGVALGPKPRSYRQRTPKKMVQLALRGALSDRARSGRVVVVDAWDFPTPKTRDARAALTALGIDGKALVVLGREDENAHLSFRNLPGVQVMLAGELNTYDILCNDWLVFTRATLPGAQAEPEAEAEARTEAEAQAEPEPEPEGDAP